MKIDYAELSAEQTVLVKKAHYEYVKDGSMGLATLMALRTSGIDPDELEKQFDGYLVPNLN
jgi:hypothetical protein